jgi:hypothetical protein
MIDEITAGVDWLSCSLAKEHIDYQVWRGDVYYALDSIAKDGYKVVPRKLLGYEGLSAGNCFVGDNDGGTYAQFSGEKANFAFDYVDHPQAKYSRLDVQMTVKYSVTNYNEGRRCYDAAMDHNSRIQSGGRRKIYIIIGSDGGDTVYLGAPSSEQRARIYNKEVQSEDVAFTRCWRYEIVLRDELSTQLYRQLTGDPFTRADECVAFVITWLATRGVVLPDLVRWSTSPVPIRRSRPTDVERKLAWLKHQVAPTVRYLTESGYRSQALDALGVEEKDQT